MATEASTTPVAQPEDTSKMDITSSTDGSAISNSPISVSDICATHNTTLIGETITSDGGALIGGNVDTKGGDFIGRDQHIHEHRGDTINGIVEGNIGIGAQIAIGKGIFQVSNHSHVEITEAERFEIRQLFILLKNQLANLELSEKKKLVGEEFINQIERELTKKQEGLDGSLLKTCGEWLLKNIPMLTKSLADLFLNPIVRKMVSAAGDTVVQWIEKRFGHLI